jgi:hypothetical protein
MREAAGVMERWSNGVMNIQVEIRILLFPTLQHSSTPILQTSPFLVVIIYDIRFELVAEIVAQPGVESTLPFGRGECGEMEVPTRLWSSYLILFEGAC